MLLFHVTAVDDWDEEGTIYRDEIDGIIRERLFPGRAVEIQRGPKVLRRGRDTAMPDYADGVHSDGGLDVDDYVHNIAALPTIRQPNGGETSMIAPTSQDWCGSISGERQT